MMMLKWFNAQEAADVGVALADQYVSAAAPKGKDAQNQPATALQGVLHQADREVRALQLNFYKKAKFANAFKWRLIENGVEPRVADGVTQSVIVHLSQNMAGGLGLPSAPRDRAAAAVASETGALLAQAKKAFEEGDFGRAVELFDEFVSLVPGHADALNQLGVALYHLGRYQEAEQRYRESIDIDPQNAGALLNLAGMLQASPLDAEPWLRRVLKINPKYPGARAMLGIMLASSGRLREAKTAFHKALKLSPNDATALLGLAQIARSDGRFDYSESLLKRALQITPKMPTAWAALQWTRKMTPADTAWLSTAKEIASSGVNIWEESELRFAMGKFCDDVGDFEQAFANYRRGNELLKSISEKYDRQAHSNFVDDLVRVHTPQAFASITQPSSASAKPIFVLGMPRSGTSLVEQIIASHPAAKGAGELEFWLQQARKHHFEIRRGILDAAARTQIADDYLRLIERECPNASRIVDKTPTNSDFLGLIHSVFPNAHIIRMRRDPIDTCLSCYFQHFSTSMRFSMDLTDLADYYRIHERAMDHWCSALPAGAVLEVSYENLVADQEGWTRKMLDFVGLEWDERCLMFHDTQRPVATSSAWQVRQKIYKGSVERWRNYERFIGPLKGLRD